MLLLGGFEAPFWKICWSVYMHYIAAKFAIRLRENGHIKCSTKSVIPKSLWIEAQGIVWRGSLLSRALINSCFRLLDHCSVFQAEVAAIKGAADVLLQNVSYREVAVLLQNVSLREVALTLISESLYISPEHADSELKAS